MASHLRGLLPPCPIAKEAALSPKRIQLSRRKGWRMPQNTVKVDRSTKWGNPFVADSEGVAMECVPLGLDGEDRIDRATASVDLFRRWLTGGKVNELIAAFLPRPKGPPPAFRLIQRDLRGKNLACWCKLDAPCHADVLLEIANRGDKP
ncbi:DUF4326 domain-containing protein [Mesorhizobium sp. YC-39]|uniref:DUF4326 domain-containing protein n=1 Tax=unclassified Mesorhizobium TaxID=325217 RepID=UPI0021E9A45A|nr:MULTISPECIES: DUF4326 domain-containing protein [unclassified Mesorhizobium]MCV3209645.1 DUF4326 domain-containing protein [Mesorhizobium sp. YC-2]MCV3230175.1 DUF4326 domain-containing protein [Mesorhizobium sp. YC-39]